ATAWAVSDTIEFVATQNMGETKPYEVMGERTTCRTIAQSNGEANYIPYKLNGHYLVPGKFPEEKGIRTNGTQFINDHPGISGDYSSEALWDAAPSAHSISFWFKHVTGFCNTSYNDTVASSPAPSGRVFTAAPFSLTKQGQTLAMGYNKIALFSTYRNTGNTYSTTIDSRSLGTNYMLSDEWRFYTVTNSGTTTKVYIDGVLINTWTDPNYANVHRPVFSALFGGTYYRVHFPGSYPAGEDYFEESTELDHGFVGNISEFIVWNKELSQTEIDAQFSASASTPATHLDIFWKLQFNNEIKRKFTLQNDTSRGFSNILSFGYEEADKTSLSQTNCSLLVEVNTQPIVTTINMEDGDVVYEDNFTSTTSTYYVEKSGRDKKRMYAGLRGIAGGINKFWFIADEDRVIVSYKIHDTGATSQKNPVYQTVYAGLLQGVGANAHNLTVMGTSAAPVDWQSLSTDFTCGLHNSTTGRIYAGESIWQKYSVDVGGSNEDDIRRVDSTHYVWPIVYYRAQNSGLDYEEVGWSKSSSRYTMSEKYLGTPSGVYKVSPYYVAAEDIITVDGDDYLVTQDVWASSTGDWFAIKLK
ncbi:MAG: hypothetical protein U9N61_10610, partial [Euryarchaeota archaeon]|nr:hypothetical protein [Euryarchaeota archaeon]